MGPIRSLAVVISLALTPVAAFAHGSDHPTDIRNFRNQFTYFKSPRPAPLTPILAEDESPLNLGRFHGQLVLLNFWATWCPPCVEELPALDRLQGLLGTDRFAVVAVSIDKSTINVPVSYVKRLGLMNLNVYLDFTGRAQVAFPLYGLPITYLIDPDGAVVGYIIGATKWDSPEAVDFLRHYLGS